ncbi:MAG: N-acetylmuramoyl-L-alanine amidase [Bacteroidales bacterium 45-6]|nr:MAG: N-acetylmuramoyl-L-alanine amidase [Bacteroidales bacterium 45-6]
MRSLLLPFLVVFLLAASSPILEAASKRYVLVIDAGHGGKDFGAVRGQYKEKEINLEIALKLGELIEQNMPDVRVVYTRQSDVFVELDQRSAIANKAKANLFISIHTNATETSSTTASGAETYILGLARSKENLAVAKRENAVILLEDDYSRKYEGFDPKSPESYIIFEFMTNKYMEQSYEMASYVQSEFRKSTNQRDKGVRQAGFLVLRKSGMPSLLVEVGFINNPSDGAYITSRSGQSDLALAIYNAFKKYKREFDKKQGIAVHPSKGGDNSSADSLDEGQKGHIARERVADNTNSSLSDRNSGKTSDRGALKDKSFPQGIEYRLQICTSPKKLSQKSSRFKGLSPVDYYIEGNLYKYTYGSATSMREILRIQKEVGKLFKDAFVVKFKNGKKLN